MATNPTDDGGIESEVRDAFDVCDGCGAFVVSGSLSSHRCPGENPTVERAVDVSADERERRREADTRPASTTVLATPSASGQIRSYHETTDCPSYHGEAEPMTLATAIARNRVPCATGVCRRERGDLVYGTLYEPLDD
jgi:hypothetical protein